MVDAQTPGGQSRMKRRIGVITAGRNDFGIYLPVLQALKNHEELEPVAIVTGTHMDSRYGETVRDIEAAGFSVDYSIPIVPETDHASAVVAAMGQGMVAFSKVLDAAQLDMLMVLGDRFEMFAMASCAVPFALPVVHLHGGEVTEGAIDEQFRHAMSKLSHLHFTATETYRNRLLQMGEEPWRVVVSGAPGIDHLNNFEPWSLERLSESLDFELNEPPLLITFHPVTLHAGEQVDELLAALEDYADRPVVITYPNSDLGCEDIIDQLERFAECHANVGLYRSLGTQRYFSMMHHAAAMVGNSSSGIIEAASFGLPVVNIGDRQAGRERGKNVIDVTCERSVITDAIAKALSAEFKMRIHGMPNPYGSGDASRRIVETLASTVIDERLVRKRFVDIGELK
jgi:UDP-hydrolysing UDP-N-acetyl-D-glucosamine 2-epimerase